MSGESNMPRILLATDFSKWALRAEDYACCLAATWRATLRMRAMSATEVPPNFITKRPIGLEPFMSPAARTPSWGPGWWPCLMTVEPPAAARRTHR